MVAVPGFSAAILSRFDVAGEPAGISTFAVAAIVAVESDTTVGSLLVNVTTTASPAGDDNETGNAGVSPTCSVRGISTIIEPLTFVSGKATGLATPGADASTAKLPGSELAVNTGEIATPDALVSAVAVLPPPANDPLGPVAGAVNVTGVPTTGLPPIVTVAIRGPANAVFVAALCGVPPVAVIIADPATGPTCNIRLVGR